MTPDKKKLLWGFLLTIVPAALQFVSSFWGIHIPIDLGGLGDILQMGSQTGGAAMLASAKPGY